LYWLIKPYQPKDVHLVAKAGIARTFQNIRLFAEMTALENVMVARHVRTHSGLLGAIFRTRNFKQEEKEITERAHELLAYVGIDTLADVKARTLSYGDQRRFRDCPCPSNRPATSCIRRTCCRHERH
jgi:branched-chain amino acid transport system ATP-binding protein